MAGDDGLLSAIGEGLRGIGAVANPQVAENQARERANALPNMIRSLQIKGMQDSLDADTKFSEAVSGMQPSALKTSADVMGALSKVPLDVIAKSPKAQQALKIVGTMQQREAAQEQRKQALQLQYDSLEQRREAAAQRSEDVRLGAEERARHNLEAERIQTALVELRKHLGEQKSGGGPDAPKRDYTADYAKLDDAGKTALDMQAWNYINKGFLPYRKGTGGGADRNDPIIHRAGTIANELGMTAQELSGKSAEYKSNAMSLANSSKKLNAVQATLESFHNNINTWESIADGETPKLGGQKLAEIKDKLKKIDLSSVKTLNDWELRIRTQFNDPAAVAYVTSAFTVAMDYSRIMSSQGQSAAAVTEGARNEALKLISAGYNKDARKALIGTLESETAGQVRGLETQTDRIRKKLGLRADVSTVDQEKPKEQPKGADKAAVESAGWTYEPDKFDYRISNGKLQRKPKGG